MESKEYGFSTDGKDFYGRHPSRAAAVEAGQKKHPRGNCFYTGVRVKDGNRVQEILVDPDSIECHQNGGTQAGVVEERPTEVPEPAIPVPESAAVDEEVAEKPVDPSESTSSTSTEDLSSATDPESSDSEDDGLMAPVVPEGAEVPTAEVVDGDDGS